MNGKSVQEVIDEAALDFAKIYQEYEPDSGTAANDLRLAHLFIKLTKKLKPYMQEATEEQRSVTYRYMLGKGILTNDLDEAEDYEAWKGYVVEPARTDPSKEPIAIAYTVTTVVEEDKEEDVEMSAHLDAASIPIEAPHFPEPIPSSPVDWFPDIDMSPMVPDDPEAVEDNDAPYVPASPTPEDSSPPYTPRSPEPDELEAIKDRIAILEEQFEVTQAEWKWKIKSLEDQMFNDGCVLTELKWKTNELKALENKAWTNKKKTYRRGPNNPIPHRYGTRLATAEGRIASLQSEITSVKKRIKTIEDKIEASKEEADRLRKKVDEAMELAPRVRELAQSVENSKKIQDDTNTLIFSEIAAARHATSTSLGNLIQQNASEIASLSVRYQQIYNFITGFLNGVNANDNNPRNNNYSRINVPSSKLVTAF